jgi:hypothetical protein
VIPTLGSVFAFLLLVAPGLVFQRTRERVRPALRETAFREAGNIALASVAFHLAALALTAPLLFSLDLSRWIREGHLFVAQHLPVVAFGAVFELGAAALFAFIVPVAYERRRQPAGPRLRRGPLWFRAFREEAPPSTAAFVQVNVEGGTEYWGQVGNYTSEDVPMGERELELGGPIFVRLPGEADLRALPADVSRVVLPGGVIHAVAVTYLRRSGPASD